MSRGRQTQELDGLLERIASLGPKRKPVVVFDLDDTLLSTDGRHLRIIAEFAARPGVSPKAAKVLKALKASQVRYSVVETASQAGVEDQDVLDSLRSFWWERFFKNEYLLSDEPVPGAAEYCRASLERGAQVVYMTGRDEEMRSGTEESLKRWKFPLPDGKKTRLVLKSKFGLPDLEYKRDAMPAIGKLGTVAGSFENEPAHINIFHDAFPEAWHFQVETKHTGRPIAPYPATRRIADFRR